MSSAPSHRARWLVALAGGAALVAAVVFATAGRDPTAPAEPAPEPTASEPRPEPTAPPVIAAPAPNVDDPGTPPLEPAPTPPVESHVPATMPPETGPSEPARSTTLRRPPGPFDEPAARALIHKNAARVRACKADSTFRNIETTVRLTGTVTVTPRGRATLVMPAGYDITPCLERALAGLRFAASEAGGSFEYTFLL
jgi:hypothetical protein